MAMVHEWEKGINASLRSREGRDAMGCTTTSQRTLLTLGAAFNCTRDSPTIQNEMKQLHPINQVFRGLVSTIPHFVPPLCSATEPSGSESTPNAMMLHQSLKEQQRNRVANLLVSFFSLMQAPHWVERVFNMVELLSHQMFFFDLHPGWLPIPLSFPKRLRQAGFRSALLNIIYSFAYRTSSQFSLPVPISLIVFTPSWRTSQRIRLLASNQHQFHH